MHVTHPKFGVPPRGKHNDLRALEQVGAYIPSSIHLQIVMSEAYDTTYGLYDDRVGNVAPFATHLVHPGESLAYRSQWKKRMREYRAMRVRDILGLDFYDFVSAPRHMVEWMLEECELANKSEDELATGVMNTTEKDILRNKK